MLILRGEPYRSNMDNGEEWPMWRLREWYGDDQKIVAQNEVGVGELPFSLDIWSSGGG